MDWPFRQKALGMGATFGGRIHRARMLHHPRRMDMTHCRVEDEGGLGPAVHVILRRTVVGWSAG
jgi:hypothetical protein